VQSARVSPAGHKNNNLQEAISMRKSELTNAIVDRTDLTQEVAKRVLNALLDQITQAVDKENVTLVGFGTFEKRHRGARTGKNPQTGEPVKIRASNTVAFKPGKNLRESIG
jgi:DNA-binding protein HU-alpha